MSPHGKGGHADILPLGFEYVRTALKRALQRAGLYGVGGCTTSGMRRPIAPHRACGDLVLAHRLFRHSDIRTTRGYLHPDSDGSQRACGKPKTQLMRSKHAG